MRGDVLDPKPHHVAATQLAVDREIEERRIPRASCELQSSPDGPDVRRLQRWFRSDELALVPGSAWGRDGAGLVDGLHGPSPISSEKGRTCSGVKMGHPTHAAC
jgi:hypothetical protein